MINVVYVDVYFCFNFLMDFFCLWFIRLLLKEKKLWINDSIGALIGAVYATIVLILGKGGGVETLFTYIMVPLLIGIITESKRTLRKVLQKIGMLYFSVFLISGIINAFYYSSISGKNIVEKTLGFQIGEISVWFIGTILIISIAIIKVVWIWIQRNINSRKDLYKVVIVVGDKKLNVIGLRDTGNQLIEPITGKSVFIIEQNLLRVNQVKQEKPIYIPFNSVGKEHGVMEGFVGDRIEIEDCIVEKPIIGIHKGKLNQEDKYNMILPPNIIKGESK